MSDTAPLSLLLIALTALPVALVAGLVWRKLIQQAWFEDIAPDERLLAAIRRQESLHQQYARMSGGD